MHKNKLDISDGPGVSPPLPPPIRESSNWYGWYVTGLFSFGYFLSYLDRAIVNVLIEPIKHDLDLSDTGISILIGFSFAFFFAVAGIPLGRMADRGNRKLLIFFSVITWGLATMASGLSKGFWSLFATRTVMGCGEAGLSPAAMSILSDYFSPEKRSMAIATFLIGGVIGGAGAGLFAGVLLNFGEDLSTFIVPWVGTLKPWQWVFIIVGLPALPYGLLVLLTVKEPERHEMSADTNASYKDTLKYVRKNWQTYTALIMGITAIITVNMGYLSWGIPIFIRVHGMEIKDAAFFFMVPIFVFGLIGNYAVVGLGRHLMMKRGMPDGFLRAGQYVALGVFFPMFLGPLMPDEYSSIALLGPAIGFMIGSGALMPVAINVIIPNQYRGQSMAIASVVSSILAGGVGPIMIALMTDFIYRDESLVHYSAATMAVIFLPLAYFVLRWGRPYFCLTVQSAKDNQV